MTRTLALVGLVVALALSLTATALLLMPAGPAPPAAAERVAAPAANLGPDLPAGPARLDALPAPPGLEIRDADVLVRRAEAPPPAAPAVTPPVLLEGTRVRVARLGIDLPLRLGDASRDIAAQATPADAAFLLPSSAVPGTLGNAYVYAHARAGLFLALWNARIGDRVDVVESTGTVLRYVVTEIHPRVATSDLRFVGATGDERLTLQTSTGPSASDPRFVVVARLAE